MGFSLDSFFEDLYLILEEDRTGFASAEDTLDSLKDLIVKAREYAFECGQVEEYE